MSTNKCTCGCFSFITKRPTTLPKDKSPPAEPVKVITNKFTPDIQKVDNTPKDPQDMQAYKYNCPICLRYFNTILVFQCCGNYVCRECLYIMIAKHKMGTLLCPLCGKLVKSVVDVDPQQKLRFYSDNAEGLYSWYMKKKDESTHIITEEAESKKKSTERTPLDMSLDSIEIHEIEEEEPGQTYAKIAFEQRVISSIKPRMLDFVLSSSKNSPMEERIWITSNEKKGCRQSSLRELPDESINEYSVSDKERSMQPPEEMDEDVVEMEGANVPKVFVAGNFKRVGKLN